jgi:tRNA A37 threonylcarbamoyladenosine dehydratase
MPDTANSWKKRTELLVGSKNLEAFHKANILVVGLGGVGACAAEMLCRAGIGHMTIVDGDTIQHSNLNRQLHSLNSNIGLKKANVLAKRLQDINPSISLEVIDEYITKEEMGKLFNNKYDYVIDAIDTIAPKIQLIVLALEHKIPLISSMGAGGKYDPTLVKIADISESHTCNLARSIRKRLHKLKIYDGFKVVFSGEEIDDSCVIPTEETNKRSIVGTISYMPAIFGSCCASAVLTDLMKDRC